MKKLILTLCLLIVLLPTNTLAQELKMPEEDSYKTKVVELKDVKFYQNGKVVKANLIEDKKADTEFKIEDNTVVVDQKSKSVVKDYLLDRGQKIITFFNKNAQEEPEVVALVDKDDYSSVLVGKLDDDYTIDDYIQLKNLDKVEIVNEDETPASVEDLVGKDIVVFYDVVTRSMPGQTTPQKVIILNEK